MRERASAVEDIFDDLAVFKDGDRGVEIGAAAAKVVFCDRRDLSLSGPFPGVGGEAFRLDGCLKERLGVVRPEDQR